MTEQDLDDPEAQLLRKLGSGDAFDRQEAVEELGKLPVTRLAELAQHPVDAVREGLARVLVGRTEPELTAALLRLAEDRQFSVRKALSESISRTEGAGCPDEVLVKLARDSVDDVALPVITPLSTRPSQRKVLVELVRSSHTDWDVRQACITRLGLDEDVQRVVKEMIGLAATVDHDALKHLCLQQANRRLADLPARVPRECLPPDDVLTGVARTVRGWNQVQLPALQRALDQHAPVTVDLAALSEFGRDLTADAERGALPRAFHLDAAIEAIERVVTGSEPRSVVLAGPNGVGKTAAVYEFVHRLRERGDGGWRVLRISPMEFLVGTKYLGEWETRIKELIELIGGPGRVILFIPGLEQLTEVGTHEHNTRGSAATMLAPDIASGRVVVVGETTPEAWSRATATNGAFQQLFARVDMAPLPRAETRDVLEFVALDAAADVDADALDVVLEVADVYLSDTELPGRAVGLLRRMTADDAGGRLGRGDVLRTLQEATGIPPDFLDDSIAVKADSLRDFFEARVMGQPDAVDQVVDLCLLVKAGLDDPRKPSGVLLFVGPTGVGKTELSRALAELLFGDEGRLLRFDMSEYASYESYGRLIGTNREPGTLTDAVRRQPFSVVLLDEIEKAHQNVFDLCLQIFDAGRLTDGAGRTVSFRKSIVIMTSNLGSAVRTEAGIGFDESVPPPPTAEEIDRSLRQFFRPEFLGRVDQVVRFDALSRETADKIARREVTRVLGRGGIRRRKVSVDVDASVYAKLLREGYSPALGARPLKRAVESLLLMPIARLLAGQDAPAGACIQLTVASGDVQAHVLRADDEADAQVQVATPPDVEALCRRLAALAARAAELDGRRTEILGASNSPGYWDDARRAGRDMDELRCLEGLLERYDRLEADLAVTRANPNPRTRQRHVEREGHELRRLERLFAAATLGDAFLRLTAVRSADSRGLDGVERLARMYAAWARRQDMDVKTLDDRSGGSTSPDAEDTITLAVQGSGAYALLSPESGLHKLRRDTGDGAVVSELVRVDVLLWDSDPGALSARDVDVDVRPLQGVSGRLVTTLRSDVHLVHRPTMTSLRAWSPAPPKDAPGRLIPLLRASVGDESDRVLEVVRRYGFGRQAAVRDQRTGRSTGRVDRVLGGELHLIADV